MTRRMASIAFVCVQLFKREHTQKKKTKTTNKMQNDSKWRSGIHALLIATIICSIRSKGIQSFFHLNRESIESKKISNNNNNKKLTIAKQNIPFPNEYN